MRTIITACLATIIVAIPAGVANAAPNFHACSHHKHIDKKHCHTRPQPKPDPFCPPRVQCIVRITNG